MDATEPNEKGSGPGPGEVTLEEAFALALRAHRGGDLPQAERIYRAILTAVPDHADSLHFLGLLLHQAGESAAGVELIRRAVALKPDYAAALNNLGNIHYSKGRAAEAVEAWRRAVAVVPQPESLNNLGVALKGEGRYGEAEEALRQALSLDPARGDARYNLGNVLSLMGRLEEAQDEWRRAIELDPGFVLAHETLARTLVEKGRTDEAREVFEQLLLRAPDNPVARHMLAALAGEDVPARASDAYLVHTFDAFADTFDGALKSLGYRAPEVLAADAAAAVAGREGQLDVLDAGCGTGLCGPLLRPLARRLVGVDLSEKMLARAGSRGVYDELVQDELTGFLAKRPGGFDLIVAGDTLLYFGDLREVLSASAGALRGGGALVFNLEDGGAEVAAGGFRLQPSGRYDHDEHYVQRALAQAGLGAIAIRKSALRKEQDAMVTGLFVLARKDCHDGPAAGADGRLWKDERTGRGVGLDR
jgi:predicted TPR repeat methyltransferase